MGFRDGGGIGDDDEMTRSFESAVVCRLGSSTGWHRRPERGGPDGSVDSSEEEGSGVAVGGAEGGKSEADCGSGQGDGTDGDPMRLWEGPADEIFAASAVTSR